MKERKQRESARVEKSTWRRKEKKNKKERNGKGRIRRRKER
jgi:hypothetical protein